MTPADATLSSSRLARTCLLLFGLSSAFPVVASLIGANGAPRLVGIADVGVAALLVVSAMLVAARHRDRVTDRDRLAAQRQSQLVFAIIPALLVLFFVAGDRVNWTVLVIGLAWRAWLFLYTLPLLAAARRE